MSAVEVSLPESSFTTSPVPTKQILTSNRAPRVIDIRGLSVSHSTPPIDGPYTENDLLKPVSPEVGNEKTTKDEGDRETRKTVVRSLLSKSVGPVTDKNGEQVFARSLPTLLLYDDRGLEIYDEITDLEEYYLVEAETDVLRRHSDDFVSRLVKDGDVFIELGCGSMRKTRHLLSALVRLNRRVTYAAVDLEPRSLEGSVRAMAAEFPPLNVVGILGTYDDALEFLRGSRGSELGSGKKIVCWFGSSIGNFTREDATAFLRNWRDEALKAGDLFLVGIDRRNDKRKIELAYNDPHHVTERFIMNGLQHANRILGASVFLEEAWVYEARYNETMGRHEAFYRSTRAQTLHIPASAHSRNGDSSDSESGTEGDDGEDGVTVEIQDGELLHVEFSYKYSSREVEELADGAGMNLLQSWPDALSQYDLHLLSRPSFHFPLSARPVTRDTRDLPSAVEWREMWAAWDQITTVMVDKDRVTEKPISLRHPFLFYMGHLPGFLDIQLSRELKAPLTEPAWYADIFERGIDPDLDDPTKCHPHSEVPDQWPSVEDVLSYRNRCRARLLSVLEEYSAVALDKPVVSVSLRDQDSDTDTAAGSPRLSPENLTKELPNGLARVIWMCFEHDLMHAETVLYMLVQGSGFNLPHGVSAPVFARRELVVPSPSPAVSFPTSSVILGAVGGPSVTTVGWDIEFPAHEVTVPAFQIQSRPITNAEYFAFLQATSGWTDAAIVPASWTVSKDGERRTVHIKTAVGRVSLESEAQDWPTFVSATMASAYADWQGDGWRLPTEAEVSLVLNKEHKEGSSLVGQNVGFARWLPTPCVSTTPGHVSHLISSGWELTSTVFEGLPGFEADPRYPGYAADFFDNKHSVVLGGSWATHPRIAGRRTFRNWYQAGYPYVFSKFRLARTITSEDGRLPLAA